MASESEGIGRVQDLLEEIERRLEERGDVGGSTQLFPWLRITNLPRFLDTMRNEIRAVEAGKGPIGYPVTTAVWQDLVKKLETLARVLSSNGQ